MKDASSHRIFLDALDASQEAVFKVARFFYDKGIPCAVNPIQRAPDPDQWKDFKDSGDLTIHQRVEVKGTSKDWTGPGDFPYPNMIVCAKHSYDQAFPKPYAYLQLNKAQTVAAVIYSKTEEYWTEKTIKDPRYEDYEQVSYLCPVEHIEWRNLC